MDFTDLPLQIHLVMSPALRNLQNYFLLGAQQFLASFCLFPKNPDPSKVAILRTQKHPLRHTGFSSPLFWRVQSLILRVFLCFSQFLVVGS